MLGLTMTFGYPALHLIVEDADLACNNEEIDNLGEENAEKVLTRKTKMTITDKTYVNPYEPGNDIISRDGT